MKRAKASILWVNNDDGKRLVTPAVGSLYYPLIYLDDSIVDTGWSIKFLVTESDAEDLCVIVFSMLVNNQASMNFFDNLIPGSRFYLTEGKTKVAEGIIQEIID